MNSAGADVSSRSGQYRPHTLADTPFARNGFISDDERIALGEVLLSQRAVAANDRLIRKGASPENLYLLSDGWAFRSITTRSGSRQIPTLIAPGGVCNLDNLLFERADFGVRAITDATVTVLPRDTALELSARYPGVARAFTLLALAENAILTQWAVGLGRRSSLERLAHLLCEMSIRVGPNDADGTTFDLPLTQMMMGDVLGLTGVHVNRSMQHLRVAGYIATARGSVTILDAVGLRHLAQFDPSYLEQIATCADASPAQGDRTNGKPPPSHFPQGKEVAHLPPTRQVEAAPRPWMRDEDVLLRETRHRASNDLQLIVGLLELQGRRAASEETCQALADAVDRIAIIARAREALNRQQQPSLEAALRQVGEALQAYAEPRAILISTHIECEISGLSLKQVTTLSLVVNELATNAIKHAFNDDRPGHVHIRVRPIAGRDLTVIVDDDGSPFDNVPTKAEGGLGLELARRMMASIGGLFIPPPTGSKAFELRLPVNSS